MQVITKQMYKIPVDKEAIRPLPESKIIGIEKKSLPFNAVSVIQEN